MKARLQLKWAKWINGANNLKDFWSFGGQFTCTSYKEYDRKIIKKMVMRIVVPAVSVKMLLTMKVPFSILKT